MTSFLLVSRCPGQGSPRDLGLVLWFQSHFNVHSLCGVVLVLGFLVSLGLLLVPAGLLSFLRPGLQMPLSAGGLRGLLHHCRRGVLTSREMERLPRMGHLHVLVPLELSIHLSWGLCAREECVRPLGTKRLPYWATCVGIPFASPACPSREIC